MASRELLDRVAWLEARVGSYDGMPRNVLHDYVGLADYHKPPWQIVRQVEGATLVRNTITDERVVVPHGSDEGVYC